MIALLLALPAVVDCSTAASGLSYRQCLGELVEQSDAAMVKQWRAALASTRREDRENRAEKANKSGMAQGLLESQRAWLRYRKSQCSMVADQAAGGTGFGENWAECFIELTRQRAIDLNRRASGTLRYTR